jgi:hypothetical protein
MRGKREPLGPSCASSAPAVGRSLALGEGDPHPLLDRVRLFARERENVAQEGFDALVHRAFPAVPAVSLADSPFAVESPVQGRRAIVTARRSGFGRSVDETEHIEHVLAAFNVRHGRCHRSH